MYKNIIRVLVLMSLIGCTQHGKPPQMVDGRVRFTAYNSRAHQVFISGSFNGWHQSADLMTNHGDGIFTIDLSLPVGFHEYRFQIDDQGNIIDPNNPATTTDITGFQKSVLNVSDLGEVELRAPEITADK